MYVLCFLLSAAIAFLLLRAWARTRTRLLLWTGLGFAFLCLNNLVLIFDKLVFPSLNLDIPRALPGAIGAALIVYGLTSDRD